LVRLNSRRVAAIAVFAALYGILRLIPVSPLIGLRSSLTMGEVFSPLAGMVLGPIAGGLSVLLGTFLTVVLGRPLSFDGLDFIPGVVAALTAGLAMNGRVRWSVGLSILLMAIFTIDPLSAVTVPVGQFQVPFLWMHILSVITMLAVAWRVGRSEAGISNPLFIVAVVFISTMNAHVSGSIMFENVLVRINGVLKPEALSGIWKLIFFVYPFERAFFLIVGSVLAIPVLRTLSKRALGLLRGRTKGSTV
jgi:hypothetical protein